MNGAPPATVIEVDDLSRHYGAFRAVDRVSFEVFRGEIFGYLGANGAGKSTTIRMLCGLLRPTSGDARVAGHLISAAPERVKSSIGYMSQKFSLYLDLPARANLEFFGGAYGIHRRVLAPRIDEVVGLTGLTGYEERTTGALPGGIRQRLALACALLHRPEILFLDEPTAGVDPVSRRDFWRLIRELAREGTTVFVTTHYMDEAEYCARVGLMVDGRLVALDTPAELKRAYVPGRTLAVHGEGLVAALPAVRELRGVLAADPFGAGLHVRFDPRACDDARVVDTLRRAGGRVGHAEPAEASLEDVFLAVAGGATRAAS